MSNTLLEIDHDLPDHTEELEKVDDYIKQIKYELSEIKNGTTMSNVQYIKLWDMISNTLLYLGKLSEPILDLKDCIKDKYFIVYKKTPELARTLWLKHAESLNKPYDKHKNRLFRLFEEIDKFYIKCNKKNPPEEW